MSSPLRILPSAGVILPPAYCAPAAYYALAGAFGSVTVDAAMRFDKRRKEVHRMTVADTRGPLQLTVPIAKPESRSTARWCDIRVSDHGDWWAVHRTALESAYGRTPYFEFYIDSLLPLMEPRRQAANEPVTDLCRMANDVILSLLGIDTQVHYRTDPDEPLPADAIDLRSADISTLLPEVTYWQVRAEKLGFIGGLSVLDLIFNMGTEAPLILSERIKSPEFVKNLEARHMAATL